MPPRMLLLNDDELTLLVSWGEVAKSASFGHLDDDSPIVLHDWEDEDDELTKKIEAARLK